MRPSAPLILAELAVACGGPSNQPTVERRHSQIAGATSRRPAPLGLLAARGFGPRHRKRTSAMTTRLQLRPAAVQRATYQFWHAYVPPGYTVADLLVPTVWALQADRLRQHDLVRASAANGSFDVMLTVQNKWLAAWLADPHG